MDRIETELDLVKLMRTMRSQKILLKSLVLDKTTSLELAHTGKNLIDLSASEEDEEDEAAAPEKTPEEGAPPSPLAWACGCQKFERRRTPPLTSRRASTTSSSD